MGYAQIPSEDEELAHKIIGAAIEVHINFNVTVLRDGIQRMVR
jgi:hypothetical protein